MLNSVEVRPANGGPVLMTLLVEGVDPNSPVVVKSISGLGPADVTVFKGDFSRDGGYYQGRRSAGRNVVLTLKLNADWANDTFVNEIREDLYSKFLEPALDTDGVMLVFKDPGFPDRYAIGYVETLPVDIFTKETTVQISLICVDPFLKSYLETTDSDVAGWASTTIPYDGTKKTGGLFNLEVKTNTTEANVWLGPDPNPQHLLLTGGNFLVGQTISINTTPGSRWIRQNGSDVMALLSPLYDDWLQLNKGDNLIRVSGGALGDGKVVLKDYTFRSAWWGA
jgi:hypothetical protein